MTETTPTQEMQIDLSLSVSEVNVVIAALQELPHRAVDSLIRNIVTQAQAQVASALPADEE